MPPETCTTDGNANVTGSTAFPENLSELSAWRDRYAPQKPIWMTETGYDSAGPFGTTEAIQAARLPRVVMLCLANGVEKVLVYRETGSTPSMHACSGVLCEDFAPKPSWYTFGTLIRQFHGVRGGARDCRMPTEMSGSWNGTPAASAPHCVDCRRCQLGWSSTSAPAPSPILLAVSRKLNPRRIWRLQLIRSTSRTSRRRRTFSRTACGTARRDAAHAARRNGFVRSISICSTSDHWSMWGKTTRGTPDRVCARCDVHRLG